jgi:hypothetical protein
MMSVLRVLGYFAFVPLTWQLGNVVVKWVLGLSGAQKGVGTSGSAHGSQGAATQISSSTINAGRYIGLLERLLIVVGVVTGRWDIIAAVVALKTVARYKDLDDQFTAEYFLVGSLTSILWALLAACLLTWYDGSAGFHFISHVEFPGPEHGSILQYVAR